MSRLVVMGSGETAPTMVRVHREIFATLGDSASAPAVLLDTPFAFQMNSEELVARTRTYFADSVGHPVEVARWPRRDVSTVDQERALALLGRACWAFAGPGSPTYALRQWSDTPVPGALAGVVERGGTVVLGSAAAVTLGAFAVPVYEIYKVGAEPAWVAGLDLLRRFTGLHGAVVPHFDNKEGGTHDTRFCYLGETRLRALEALLPDDAGVLGVDEHTAALLDLQQHTLTVAGSGLVTLRHRDSTHTLGAGDALSLDEVAALLHTGTGPAGSQLPRSLLSDSVAARPPSPPLRADHAVADPTSLRAAADQADRAFSSAYSGGDVEGCVGALLSLEEAIYDWRSDTLQSDDQDHARRIVRAMVVRLGDLAVAGADPRGRLAPTVELLLDLRGSARDVGDFSTSDLIRDRLAAAGVEVRDTPQGPQWALQEDAP